MIDQVPDLTEQWDAGRAGKPLDYPSIVFIKLGALLMHTRLGSKERHRALQDLEDTLAPYIVLDSDYTADTAQAKSMRDRALKSDLKEVESKEAIDIHQRLWLAALMRMLKRRGLLGETWIRG